MSYGVLASKPARVQLEQADSSATPWSDGRITLTSGHLSFIPAGSTPGVRALTLSLSDVVMTEASARQFRKVVTILTPDLVLRVRVTGAAAFARQVSASVDSARKRKDDDGPGLDAQRST